MNFKAFVSVALRIFLSFAITLIMFILGVEAKLHLSEQAVIGISVAAYAVFALFLLLFLLNFIGGRRIQKDQKSVEEWQNFLLSRKEAAIKDFGRVARKIASLRRGIAAYSCFIFLMALYLAFACGFDMPFVFLLFSFYFIYGTLSRGQSDTKRFDFSAYTNPDEYPVLHQTAYRAAAQLNRKGTVRIDLTPDCNAGIAVIGNTYSLQLGVFLLDILMEEELYQILLHEFAHVADAGNGDERESRLFFSVQQTNTTGFLIFYHLLFSFPFLLFAKEYMIYRATASIVKEAEADKAIAKYGDPQIAAGALAKTAYHDFFDYEFHSHVGESYYKPETVRPDHASFLAGAFRRAVPERQAFWDHLIEVQIEPRSASHPILRNRLAALGVSEYTVKMPEESGAFRAECRSAVEWLNRVVAESRSESYEHDREENYLRPLHTVEAWEAAGKPIVAEESKALLDALERLGRYDETEAVCDRIIAESANVYATAQAHFFKGRLMLHRYDRDGIEHLYRAIEINHNYIEEGLDEIGTFCCLMGLPDDLEKYRRRAVELSQKEQDLYGHVSSLKSSDRLCEEHLPGEMLPNILTFMQKTGQDVIRRIYLVRKIISDDFFSSVFVLEFEKDADIDDTDAVCDRIFEYLDTYPEDWQFSLFVYDEKTTGAAVKKVKNACVWEKNSDKK